MSPEVAHNVVSPPCSNTSAIGAQRTLASRQLARFMGSRPSLALGSKDEVARKFIDDRDDAFNEMMFEIGRHLSFTLDRRELKKYSYAPQGWVNIEAEQNAVRQLALELLQGKRPLPVSPFQPSPSAGKFPPPPKVSGH
jgi:hypothetical protein